MILLNLRHKLIVEMRIFATFFVLDTIVIDIMTDFCLFQTNIERNIFKIPINNA